MLIKLISEFLISCFVLVDLTTEPDAVVADVSQEDFRKRIKRSYLGEDAQIMRRYLKLRSPFVRAPVPEKPVPFLSAEKLREISDRLNYSFYTTKDLLHEKEGTLTSNECSADGKDLEGMMDEDSSNENNLDVSNANSEQKIESFKPSKSFTQVFAESDEFFGGNIPDIPLMKLKRKKETQAQGTQNRYNLKRTRPPTTLYPENLGNSK